MKLHFLRPGGIAIIFLSTAAQAHTWLEQLRLIASNGTYVGTPGYPRSFVSRTSGGDPNKDMVYILPRPGLSTISAKDGICHPSQTIGAQTQGFPALVAAPKDQVALHYLENGHVTKLEAERPVRGGVISVYGTKSPSNSDTFLGIHRVWNKDGTGGDKRGKLLATRFYDDGQCYQDNPASQLSIDRAAEFPLAVKGPDLSCQTDVELPDDAGTSGTYTLYWVWDWPKVSASGQVIGNETYTGCVDIKMTSSKVPNAGSFISSQPYDSVGIKEQLNTQFLADPASFQLNTVSLFANQKTPLTTPASNPGPTAGPAPAVPAESTPVDSKPAASATKSAPQGFITVTVTGPFREKLKTVTVTDYITIGSSQTAPRPSATATQVNTEPISAPTSKTSLVPLQPSDFLPAPPPGSSPFTSFPATTASPSGSPSTGPSSSRASSATIPTTAASSKNPSSQAFASAAPSGPPAVKPFLPAPGQSTVSSPKQTSSTLVTSAKATTTSASACTETVPITGVFTATAPPANGTVANRGRYRHRRRVC